MKIYNPQGIEIYDISVDDSSVRYRAIMTDDSLTLNFAHTAAVTIPRLSYVNFEGQRYTLWRPSEFKKLSTRNFEYTLVLHGWREYLKFVKYKDMSAKPYQLKFSLTGKPIVFLQNLVATLNHHDAAGGWVAGDCIDAPEKTLSFNHEFCIDAIGRFAQEWQTEFEFEGKKIHLRKVEKFKSDPLPLSYGKGNGFLPGVGRYNEGDKQPIGRLFVQGGERNIDFSTYGGKQLLLPKSQTLTVDGKTYRTDADGMFITRDGNTNTAEDSYDASEIYPRRVGTVSEVVVVDAAKNFYDIKDSSIPEALNYRDCRIAGEKAIIKFESGALAGREFDIEQTDTDLTGYIHAERRFKIVPAELDGHIMPGGVFVPSVGDKYAIFNIAMPQAYISDNATKTGASWDMFREAVRYFTENEADRFRFTGELDGVWSKSQWLTIGGKITPGGHVLFSDDQLISTGVVIRIMAVKDYVNNPHKPEITLSNAPVSGSFSSGLAKLEADEVKIEETKKEVLRFSKRQWRDARETMEMLNASLLNYSGAINPITVQTMQLILGDESLQFRFVNSKTIPVRVNHPITFNAVNKTLSAAAGILQHMTIGITTLKNKHAASEYKYWDMAAYTSPALDASKAYYLYAKCSKTTNSGTFLLSETAIAMEGVTGFYHLLVGILNSENLGERSFASLYGYTEITPGRVVTNRIESEDGGTFFDLVNGIIGGKIRFIATGGTETNLADWADGTAQDIQDAQSAANSAALAAQQAIDDAAANVGLINTEVGKLQAQIDGEVSNWFYPYSPTLANYPASDWTTNAIKDRHIGDTFTNTAQAPATDAGKSWRFVKNGTVYSWTQIADSDAVLALQKAAQAQSTADGKSTTYLIQPTKYKFGDMWVLAADQTVNGIAYKAGEILTATQDSTTFVQSHWVKKVRYTDDTAVEKLQIGGRNLIAKKFLLDWNDVHADITLRGSDADGEYYSINHGLLYWHVGNGEGYSDIFGGKIAYKPNTQYCFKLRWKVSVQSEHAGLVLYFTYSDGLYDSMFLPGSQTSITERSLVTTAGKTLSKISCSYGTTDHRTLIYDIQLTEGNKQTGGYLVAPEDVQAEISSAKQEALTAAGNAQTSANNANTAVGDLNSYVDGSFKDGVIEASEAKAIEKYINVVNTEKSNLEATYNTLYANTYLEGTAKTTLLNTKVTYFGAVDTLLNSINTAVADGKTTIAEKQAVDTNYASYKTALASLQTAIENANKAIQTKLDTLSTEKVDNLRIGVRNFFKKTTPLSAYWQAPPYTNTSDRIEKTDNGFNYTGVPESLSDVRANYVITGNGEWTVSFEVQSNAAGYPFYVDVCDLGETEFYVPQVVGEWGKCELTVNVTNYGDGSVYNFVDFSDIQYLVFNVRNLMVVQGNKAPESWIEAPEDIQARIDAVNATAADAQAKANISKAVTDKFGTTIDGGLIGAVTMLLRELNSTDETAGISGIRGANRNLPAFWTGTYADAIAGTAGIIFRHNSTGKIGVLDVDANGNVKLLDSIDPSIVRLLFSKSAIPSIESIRSGSDSGSVQNASVLRNTTITTILPETATIANNGVHMSISGSLRISAGLAAGSNYGEAYVGLSLYKNDVFYSIISQYDMILESASLTTETTPFNVSLNVPAGTYSLVLETSFLNASSGSQAGTNTATTMTWVFEASIRRFEWGTNGFMNYRPNGHIHHTEEKGLDIRGATNTPGILLSGSVAAGGGFVNSWGAKKHDTLNAQKTATGTYTVYHSVGHTGYSVQITPETDQRVYYIPTASKGTSSFIVYFRNLTGTLSDSNFSFSIMGDNYIT